MGKVKRIRQKLHNSAQRAKEKEKNDASQSADDVIMDYISSPNLVPADPTAIGYRGENLFSNMKIASSQLAQKLPDFDARSSITSKTFKGMNLTKKEKQKMRREAWMSKIDHIQTAKKIAAETKRKQRTPIVGDLTPIHDALPTLELLMKKSSSDEGRKKDSKSRPTLKEKDRKQKMLDDISLFRQVLKHPLFKENEKTTITEHLKIAMQRQKDAS